MIYFDNAVQKATRVMRRLKSWDTRNADCSFDYFRLNTQSIETQTPQNKSIDRPIYICILSLINTY